MVVVLKEPKLIFIEEPRTASRSTHIWMVKHLGGISPWQPSPHHPQRHMGPEAFKHHVRQNKVPRVAFLRDRLSQYASFAVVRNPFSTLVTYYLKAKSGVLSPHGRQREHDLAASTRDFKEFIVQLLAKYPGLLSEQQHLCRLDACQHTLRFEDGYPDVLFKFLQERGMDVTKAQRKAFTHTGKTRNKRDWRSHYKDDKIIDVVAGIYQQYLLRFGYDKPLPI